MSLFKPAENQMAYLKAGFMGFQGSGKTYTACQMAIGLYKYAKLDKPVFMLDTETGSDWAIPTFKAEGVDFHVAKTRAFKDLLAGIRDAESNASILLVDSVTHYWKELLKAFQTRLRVKRLQFHHWGPIKDEWGQFSDAFVNSNLHMIVCGRAGYEYDYEENDDGSKDLLKTGTRMKAEGEFGFEPSLLVEMERARGKDIGATVNHIGHVLKDRRMDGNGLDGKTFTNPTFKDFMPHIEYLNIGGDHLGVDTDRNSEEMFDDPDWSATNRKRRVAIALENIQGELEAAYPGTGKKEKIAKAALKKHLFGTYSDTDIANRQFDELENALSRLVDIFAADGEADKIIDNIVAKGKKEEAA